MVSHGLFEVSSRLFMIFQLQTVCEPFKHQAFDGFCHVSSHRSNGEKSTFKSKLTARGMDVSVRETDPLFELLDAAWACCHHSFAHVLALEMSRKVTSGMFSGGEIGLESTLSVEDGDGRITITEFCKGLSQLKGQARALDMIVMQRELNKLDFKLQEIHRILEGNR